VVIVPHHGVPAEITQRAFKGAETLYTLRLASGQEILSLVPSHQDYVVGQAVGVEFRGVHLILFQRP
jgi:iron(III) transport system ATP-binding protein